MRVLVLGDGVLGSEIVQQTRWDYISRKKDSFDITNKSTYNLLTKIKFGAIQYCDYDVIVNTIACTDSYSDNKKIHYNVNYKGVANLVEFCNKWNKKLIHISTEFVYANNPPFPSEEDIPQPDSTWYAYTKLLADEHIKMFCKNYLICRELHKINNFSPKKVWNVLTNGDKVKNISELIIKLIIKNAKGIFNVGTKSKSFLDLYPKGNLIDPPKHVPKDTRMNINKLNTFLNENR